jgi:hypothetical protein
MILTNDNPPTVLETVVSSNGLLEFTFYSDGKCIVKNNKLDKPYTSTFKSEWQEDKKDFMIQIKYDNAPVFRFGNWGDIKKLKKEFQEYIDTEYQSPGTSDRA